MVMADPVFRTVTGLASLSTCDLSAETAISVVGRTHIVKSRGGDQHRSPVAYKLVPEEIRGNRKAVAVASLSKPW